MSCKRLRSISPLTTPTPDPGVLHAGHQTFRSAAIKDRSSTFIAVFSPTASAESLQAHPDFQSPTHRIAAWRKPSAQRTLSSSSQRTLFDVGRDDDGEQYGGKRLEKVLIEMNVEEGAVVVARWYGGIFLGPVRFAHIENCAREAIGKWKMGIVAPAKEASPPAAQKRKVEDDGKRRRSTIVRVLEERDQSISALRGLLRQKREGASGAAKAEDTFGTRETTMTPTKAIDYAAIPLQGLERLEKARDATLSWILKEIDKVEEEQQQ